MNNNFTVYSNMLRERQSRMEDRHSRDIIMVDPYNQTCTCGFGYDFWKRTVDNSTCTQTGTCIWLVDAKLQYWAFQIIYNVSHVYRVVTCKLGIFLVYKCWTLCVWILSDSETVTWFYSTARVNKTSNTRECIVVFKGMYIHHQRDVEADSVNHGIAGISISAEQSID